MQGKPSGFRTFLLIWFGQVISLTGSGMTRFALSVWAYQQTGAATTLALMGFASFIFYVPIGMVAGVWVDRWNRRIVMLLSDAGSGLLTAFVLLMFVSGQLAIWHILVLEALSGVLEAFQLPAYTASVTMLVDPAHRGRANGLRSLGWSLTRVFAPILGGLVLAVADLRAVLLVDLATFLAAYSTLLLTRIPSPPVSAEGQIGKGHWRSELVTAFTYLRMRKGLFYLILMFMVMNFIASLTYWGVMPAMILARTGGDEGVLAAVQGAMGVFAVFGGLGVTAFIKRAKLVHWIVVGGVLSFLLGDLLMGLSRSLEGWLFAAAATEIFVPFIFTAEQTILQNKVPPDLQGRVFALDGTIRDLIIPFGFLLAGTLADHVFEPAMQPGGALASILGDVWGTGPGAGMGVMYLGTAIAGTILCLVVYIVPATRHVERDLPDYVGEEQ